MATISFNREEFSQSDRLIAIIENDFSKQLGKPAKHKTFDEIVEFIKAKDGCARSPDGKSTIMYDHAADTLHFHVVDREIIDILIRFEKTYTIVKPVADILVVVYEQLKVVRDMIHGGIKADIEKIWER